MQLREEHPDDIDAIALNLDFDEEEGAPSPELVAKVAAVLRDQAIRVRNVVCSDPTQRALDHFEVFGVPAVLVFDREGRLHRRFEGEFTYEDDVAPAVRALIGADARGHAPGTSDVDDGDGAGRDEPSGG